MKYRILGTTDIKVSEISLGCWTLGGLNWNNGYSCGWSEVDEKEATRAIHLGIEKGVNHFDNADVYGNGKAERFLAKALGSKSKEIIVATKIGYFTGTAAHSMEALHIRHQCEQSLKNLNRDVIDIYYFHNANFGLNDQYLDEAVNTMNQLKKEGKIRVIGLSDYSADAICRVMPKVKPQVIQSWASALDDHFISEGSRLRRLMEKEKIHYVAFSPLAQGLLTGKYNSKNPPVFPDGDNRKEASKFQGKSLTQLEPKVEILKKRFGKTTKELSRMALQYLLANPIVGCVIPGFRNEIQVADNLHGADLSLTTEDVKFIRTTLGK